MMLVVEKVDLSPKYRFCFLAKLKALTGMLCDRTSKKNSTSLSF